MKRLVVLGLVIVLSACGAARDLKPAAGKALPVAPYGAAATPKPTQLLTASSQARPERSDELLRSSEERQGNEFDLPPKN
ncbi:hypothetical protein FPZ24_14750 [Sphingomonas panacisoli]|uniref:Argininosuccinate lyase n=1 Tax=Sphingomonas panacisoli TaxID=1813879 RepID=A0A5B8LMA4_9SPHN|nr:hypothetical protein [Sphingomonas panacisoli]QDZ08572.1 hypothetical protein FPZ24_14750 [Sphingomonas panacisoli]